MEFFSMSKVESIQKVLRAFSRTGLIAGQRIAIEVDGPSHFFINSTRYTAYSKLKHSVLSNLGYKVIHIPFFEWSKLSSRELRVDYMLAKLQKS